MLNTVRHFLIKGTNIEEFQDIPTDIQKLLDSYTDEDKDQLLTKLSELEKQNKKLFRKILPTGTMPLYVSPLDPETEVLQFATWTQYSDVGPYSEFDDNYCRPEEGKKENYVYPRRNPETQEIELNSCNTLINTDIKEMINLNQYVSDFNNLAKIKVLELNSADVNSMSALKTDINKRLSDYNKLQDQYIQLTNLLQTNIDLINKRKKIIDTQQNDLENSENDYNIKHEIVGDDMQNNRDREKYTKWSLLILKALGIIFILIAIGLILLIDIGKVL